MEKVKTIAICYTPDHKVKCVCEVKNVNSLDYQKLCQDMLDFELEKEQVFLALKQQVIDLGHKVDKLEQDIKELKGID